VLRPPLVAFLEQAERPFEILRLKSQAAEQVGNGGIIRRDVARAAGELERPRVVPVAVGVDGASVSSTERALGLAL